MNALFEAAVEIYARGQAGPYFARATVFVAVWARDPAEAAHRARTDLTARGDIVLPTATPVRPIDPQRWDDFVSERWPGQRARLPTQASVLLMAQSADPSPIQIALHPHD